MVKITVGHSTFDVPVGRSTHVFPPYYKGVIIPHLIPILECPQQSKMVKEQTVIPSTALGLLKFYADSLKQLAEEEEEHNNYINPHRVSPPTTPTMIMQFARARLLEMNSKNADVSSIIATCFGDIKSEDYEDLEIAVTLQAAAEKIAYKKFSCAEKLLALCSHSAFQTGTPVQRTVFYFAQALKERMDSELGASVDLKLNVKPVDVKQTQFSLDPATIAHQQRFNMVAINHFTGIQSILDNIESATKIHLIDFRIRSGWQWTILMQALAVRRNVPVELIKITAIGTSKGMMEETGRWLSSFADSMELPFSFHIVVSELKELREDMFNIEADETVAIFSSLCLFSLTAYQSQLESLIRVIKNLRPCVMVVNEINQSLDSPNFIERFTKSLFFFSALFDYVSICGDKGSYRKLAEEGRIWDVIQNIVVAKGTERIFRHEKLSFWRALFKKSGFVETQISSTALYQAMLLAECSPGKNFYDMEKDGKCMTLGWKGTNVEFLSVWKFNHD